MSLMPFPSNMCPGADVAKYTCPLLYPPLKNGKDVCESTHQRTRYNEAIPTLPPGPQSPTCGNTIRFLGFDLIELKLPASMSFPSVQSALYSGISCNLFCNHYMLFSGQLTYAYCIEKHY